MISFIVTAHNHKKYIFRCLKSILKNDSDILNEIIVINDSSKDGTENEIKKISKHSKKIKYFFVNFSKPSRSKNFGVKKSSSKWIIFIDGDDFIKKNFLKKYYKSLNDNYDFIYSNIIKYYHQNNTSIENQNRSLIIKYFNNPVGGGCLIKKKIWKKIGGIDENLIYQDDYDFWLKIHLLKKIKIKHLNYAGYYYRKHKYNRSLNFFRKYKSKLILLSKFVAKKLCQTF